MEKKKLSSDQWWEEAQNRYPDMEVVFKCPVCKYKQSISECKEHGMPDNTVGFSCIGRWWKAKPGQPCNYAGGGLFRLNPIVISFPDGGKTEMFDFADKPLVGGQNE